MKKENKKWSFKKVVLFVVVLLFVQTMGTYFVFSNMHFIMPFLSKLPSIYLSLFDLMSPLLFFILPMVLSSILFIKKGYVKFAFSLPWVTHLTGAIFIIILAMIIKSQGLGMGWLIYIFSSGVILVIDYLLIIIFYFIYKRKKTSINFKRSLSPKKKSY